MIVIRKAKLEDCKACYELQKTPELLSANGEPPPVIWLEGFVKEKQMMYVAEDNKEIIGFVMAERTTSNGCILHQIVVKKEYRDKGIGKKLVDEVEKEARKRKLRVILLYGYAKNPKTVAFFEKNGFEKGSLCYEFLKVL